MVEWIDLSLLAYIPVLLGLEFGQESAQASRSSQDKSRTGLFPNQAQGLGETLQPMLSNQALPGAIQPLMTPFKMPDVGPSGLYATQEPGFQQALQDMTAQRGANLARRGFVGTNAPVLAATQGAQDVAMKFLPQVGETARELYDIPEAVRRQQFDQLMRLVLGVGVPALGGTERGTGIGSEAASSQNMNLFGGMGAGDYEKLYDIAKTI